MKKRWNGFLNRHWPNGKENIDKYKNPLGEGYIHRKGGCLILMKTKTNGKIGKNAIIEESVEIGVPTRGEIGKKVKGAIIGDNAIIRSKAIIYTDVEIGNDFFCGHAAVIREKTKIGNKVVVGTGTIIDGQVEIGNNVSIQSANYITINSRIEDNVFIGPRVCFTNDKYMGRGEVKLIGPTIRKGARIGANSTILPGIEIGEDSAVGAGSVVTKNVPPGKIVAGNPARILGDVKEEHRLGWKKEEK